MTVSMDSYALHNGSERIAHLGLAGRVAAQAIEGRRLHRGLPGKGSRAESRGR